MASELFDFDNPWRPVYEGRQAASWLGATVGCMATATLLPLPTTFGTVTASACGVVGMWRAYKAWERASDKWRTSFAQKEFITIPDLFKISAPFAQMENGRGELTPQMWMGRGFHWTDIEASKMHSLMGAGVAKMLGKTALHGDGSYWLHGLAKEESVGVPLELLEGHTLIVGTTGVGKTRLFDILIAQCIMRGEPVVIIDPKGDQGLADNARKVCEFMGHPEKFIYFNPAHPDKSASIDPLRNWNRKTELASRVAALIPSETGTDAFVAFGWKVLQDICGALIATEERPNLMKLRRYIEGGPDDLLLKALRFHFRAKVQNWEEKLAPLIKKAQSNSKDDSPVLRAYIRFYKDVVIHEHPNVDLAGLISTFEHNRDHFSKMVASLIPILSMLTTDPLADLLSPEFEPGHDKISTDMTKVITNDMVLYMGLDSLADSTVGSAIGSVMLADMTAVAGDIYNYGGSSKKLVNVFVDEAAEVINTPTIQLLNKGRGAGFKMYIATQTFADFAARLGDENKARQVLGNTNNKIILRVLDAETQKYVSDGIPKIKAQSMSVRYGHSLTTTMSEEYGAAYQEQATAEEADLIPPGILSELPPLHCYIRQSGGRTYKTRIPILGERKEMPRRARHSTSENLKAKRG